MTANVRLTPRLEHRIFAKVAIDGNQLQRIETFHDSTHAGNRRTERIVSMQAMKDVVNCHDRKTQQYKGNNGGFVYRFEKSVAGKKLVVVAEVKKTEAWLVSCFYQD